MQRGHLSIVLEKNDKNKEICTTNSEQAARHLAYQLTKNSLEAFDSNEVDDYYQSRDRNVVVTLESKIEEL